MELGKTAEQLLLELEERIFDALVDHAQISPDDKDSNVVVLSYVQFMLRNAMMFSTKQKDYGCQNIAASGEYGVLVRSMDKVARLKNLSIKEGMPNHEAVIDNWMDLANYGIIGVMCHAGKWPNASAGWRIG